MSVTSSNEEIESSESATPTPEPPGKPSFVIEIRPPARYKPGCGPTLQPLRLLPPKESNAYIIERILLPSPGLAADGKPLPKRMTYIVGWRDLPAASLLVPAMKILDYVSPKVLEDWEEKLEAEVDEERIKLAEEKLHGTTGLQKHKARPPTHTGIESAVAFEPETEPEDVGRHKMGAMSLSTPKKRKLADFEGLSDDDDSPSNQIAREMFGQTSRELSSDIPGGEAVAEAETEIEAVHMEPIRDIAPKDGPQTPPKNSRPTPVPLPAYVNGLIGHNNSFSRPPQLPALRPSPGGGVEHRHYSALVDSIEGTSSANGGGFNALGGDINYVETSIALEPTSDVPRSTSASRKANGSTKKSHPPRPTKKRRKVSPPIKEIGEDGEPTWEVERLEDVARYDVEGRGLVRYFLVRWAGDWPPDQQTSWEPEEHIPSRLIRAYTKLDKKKRAKLASQHNNKPPTRVGGGDLSAEYSSINELFDPDAQENHQSGGTSLDLGREESLFVEDDLDKEVFVVDENSETKHGFGDKTTMTLSQRVFGVY